MTNREKFLSVLHSKSNAQMPIVHFGFWDETVAKWENEGFIQNVSQASRNDYWKIIATKLGFDFGYAECFSAETELKPFFDERIIKEFPDGSQHVFSREGVIVLKKPGVVSILTEIDHTLTDRASWEKEYLPRLQFTEDRYDFSKLQDYAQGGDPIALSGGSLYGIIRNWFGVIGLSYIAVDDEELYDEVIQTVADLAFNMVKLGLEKSSQMGVKFDYINFWEDICFKTGPLINPKVFAEKIGPHYKRITDIGKQYGIEIFSVDCDGMIDHLLPTWLNNGVNTMFPIEVGTWNASIKPWRDLYGTGVLGVGGMDKRVFAYDKKAIDTEIERLKPLIALGGFLPCPDHRIAPDAKWDLVRYYCDRMCREFK